MAEDKPEEGPVEHPAFTGRPQDEPLPNTTFTERAAARQPKKKAVQSAENKAVTSDKPERKSK
jgi:hypothetical protein